MQFLPPFLLRISRRFFPPLLQMIPRDNRRSFHRMKTILQQVVRQNRPCATLATHSSELMPGGSPFFPTADSIERLYDRLEILFAAAKDFQGMTLAEFRESRDCGLEK
jgi:hypothetical protein